MKTPNPLRARLERTVQKWPMTDYSSARVALQILDRELAREYRRWRSGKSVYYNHLADGTKRARRILRELRRALKK